MFKSIMIHCYLLATNSDDLFDQGWYVDIKKAELKFLDEQLERPVSSGAASEEDIGRAWRELYMEFV